MEDVDDGLPLKTAARMHGIPITTFHGHVYGKTLSRK